MLELNGQLFDWDTYKNLYNIDTSDIPEVTDFSNARPNPYAEKIRENGYSITIHYSPEDVARMAQNSFAIMENLDMLELDPDELAALEKYHRANLA